MSVHCLLCGCVSNFRYDDGTNKSYEVKVTNENWVTLRIFRDHLLGKEVNPSKQRPIDVLWVHRDCVDKLIKECGVDSKIRYTPKRIKE